MRVYLFLGTLRCRAAAAGIGIVLYSIGCFGVAGNVLGEDGGGAVLLVENGVSVAPIVVAGDARQLTVAAAEELADYIEKISGGRPTVIVGVPDTVPQRAVWVGYQPLVGELFPDIDFDFQRPEEVLIAASGNHVVIAGRDRPAPDDDVRQLEYGTANAVFTFLQDQLGVRWFWPGELGEDYVETGTIRIAPFEYRHAPQIRGRSGMFNYYRQWRGGRWWSSPGHDWARRQRVQYDSLSAPASHGFSDWWERFGETHPEYFALQPDGSRGGYPSARTVKICKSNPAVWDQWLLEVEKQLAENPGQTLFSAAANDSWRSGYCICDNCRAWDHPDGELRAYNWRGLAQEYVAMSDRQVTFANQLARRLWEKYPDREYYVVINAYGPSRPAPVAAVPDDNVIVLNVANFFCRPNEVDSASQTGHTHREQFSAWAAVAPNIFWRPNKARHMASMPHISMPQTIDDVRFVAEGGCIGIYIDMIWGHWATRGPMYYALAQMAWDPQRDGDALMDDYYSRCFGPAAPQVRAYWDLMERLFWKAQSGTYDYPELYDDTLFSEAYGYLDAAAAAAADGPEKYRQRVAFVRLGLDYTKLVTEARREMIRYNVEGDSAALDRARSIWVDQIAPLTNNSAYRYAITWPRTSPGNGHTKRDAGVTYPEDLVNAFTDKGKLRSAP